MGGMERTICAIPHRLIIKQCRRRRSSRQFNLRNGPSSRKHLHILLNAHASTLLGVFKKLQDKPRKISKTTMTAARSSTSTDIDKIRTIIQVIVADELMSFEERILKKMTDLVHKISKMAAQRPTATADPTVNRLEPAAPPPTTPATCDTIISSQVLVVGDSIMFALSKFGLQKLCNKTVTIQSNGGAMPSTLIIPPSRHPATPSTLSIPPSRHPL